MTSLAERLDAARRRQFVGRATERDLFRDAVTASELPFVVLYIYGPGGAGKTSLLRELAYIAAAAGASVIQLDGRNLDAVPQVFLDALQKQLALPTPEAIFSTLSARKERTVVFLDTAERLEPLDGWLRDSFLPHLPDSVLVVIAGRNQPSLRWRTDAGWQVLMRVLPLKNLSSDESRAYLMRRQVPADRQEAVLHFTHGHPLALSLVADVFAQRPDTAFHPADAPDIIKILVEQFMQQVPSPEHRAALEAASQVHLLNEGLLGQMLQSDDPHPLFDWLRGLSFMEAERGGLFPHDLTREALTAELRWRNPDWQKELHSRARAYYMAHFREGDVRAQRQVLSEYIYLHRENPVIRPYFEWQTTGTVFTDRLRSGDEAALLAMVREHEGEASASIAGHWLARQPGGVAVFRQTGSAPHGLLIMISLEQTTAADRALDPGTAAAYGYLKRHAPLRPGETATLFRFWMAQESYQDVSPVQSRIFLNMVQHYLNTPGLAFTLLPCADPDFWADVFAFANLSRLPAADFEVGSRSFGVFGHDWRVLPPLDWLALMAERELATTTPAHPAGTIEPLQVLHRDTFGEAVREALRRFTDPMALQDNPLLQSRLVVQEAGHDSGLSDRASALQAAVRAVAEPLQANPRQAKWYRALYHTYFQPARTQERAAELLDLPFSTYRRHLRAGIQYLIEGLWARELGHETRKKRG